MDRTNSRLERFYNTHHPALLKMIRIIANNIHLEGKKIALFGSYGWGDGQWMRDWTERMQSAGAEIVGGEGLICNETPDEEALEECRELGKQLAS